MSFSLPVILILALVVVALVAAMVVRFRKKPEPSPLDIGAAGERYAKEALEQLPGYKRFVSNCYVPKSDGDLTEIDLILLHESGIYVIESKNFSGWIYGSEGDQNWTQYLNHATKNSFYNPIRQNKVHIKWLKQYLDLGGDIPCYSFIVFGDGGKLQRLNLTSGEHIVVNCRDLLQAVQKNAKAAGRKLSREDIDTFYNSLYPLTQRSEAEKALHVETVRQKQAAAAKKPAKREQPPKAVPTPAAPKAVESPPRREERICPKCGGKLVLRTAKKGEHVGEQFWGCSNFPKCRYKERICPKCGGELVLRTAGKGEHIGEEFWACSNFPKCRYKEYNKEPASVR